jgi:hypothetical protein
VKPLAPELLDAATEAADLIVAALIRAVADDPPGPRRDAALVGLADELRARWKARIVLPPQRAEIHLLGLHVTHARSAEQALAQWVLLACDRARIPLVSPERSRP